ncbi:storkhead-box protein 1 [Denticeps clupeoides]|uniref:Winged helix Storkhead-box1 domain-containing protein n=1 Tax=Denticeps clupeoides TaxID=299321 RepID=A0AAY4ESU0_9TELE|nr:storkhead-box protein 1 [Denticeps clupeoides]
MAQQHRVVQLSAASLAVVFGRDEETQRAAPAAAAAATSGQDVFQDFKAQNARSFWNKRLVRAVSEVFFQGWMENLVLLVQGNASNLEVLREAWMRRALRAPKGFIIKAVGDLSPVQMSPVVQSQFIPLSEVLCSVISDMNADHVTVNQEALINYMTKAHPGMSIPTPEILYNALGSLIKERKIYHTGEGYFIVTPQTYFITNNMAKENPWWTLGENELHSPPPITYLVSNESCMETTESHPLAHCKSCRCFVSQATVTPSVHDHQSVSECTGKSLKWTREYKPSVNHQSTSTAADYQASEISKSTAASRKDKEKTSRKFGLNLFRRSAAKKDGKMKKEYATVSGQFPPEEWPVRDEDDLNNLPRDLEHAIIKRINPELTVDNLVRHTVLMKKLEEREVERAVDKGMSTEIPVSKPKNSSSRARRSASKATRSKKKGQSVKEKQKTKNKSLPCGDDFEGDFIKLPTDEHDLSNDCGDLDAKCLYKKRIENPFLGLPVKDTVHTTGHKVQKKREGKALGRREHTGHRSKSWDSHHTKGTAEDLGKSCEAKDRSCEHLQDRDLSTESFLDARPVKELSGDYSLAYPKSSTLRIEDKVKHFKENKARGREMGPREVRVIDAKHEIIQDSSLVYTMTQTPRLGLCDGADQHSYVHSTTETPFSWPQPTPRHGQSLRQTNDSAHRPDLLASHQQVTTLTGSQQMVKNSSQHRASETYTENDHHLYLRSGDTEDDACSSLYLNEHCIVDSIERSHAHYQSSIANDNWSFLEADCSRPHKESMRVMLRQDEGQQHFSSTHHMLSTQPRISHEDKAISRYDPEHLHEISPRHTKPAEVVDASIFDYCQTSEVDSDTETVHKSADEGDVLVTQWIHQPHQNDSHQVPQDSGVPHCSSESQNTPSGAGSGETTESQSNTGDSGIDSPRTPISLTSSNSVILEGLKRRGFLQNLEKLHSKSHTIRAQNSLLQLTPVMNV